jgi:hypothetical protein
VSWTKLPAVEGSIACGTCGCGARSDLSMDRSIGVGFGAAGYSRDGAGLWQEGTDTEIYPTVADVEALALAEPDHDWRIYFHAPLYDAEYQRQGEGMWVLIASGPGFA